MDAGNQIDNRSRVRNNHRLRYHDEPMHPPPVGKHTIHAKRYGAVERAPAGCYHTGEGFYSPATKCLYSLHAPGEIIRIPTAAEEEWIVANCSTTWDVHANSDESYLCTESGYANDDA